MARLKFSIASLLVIVAICGMGFAALREASGYWASAMVTATIAVLLASILGAAKGRCRTAWLGFAVFGWGYFAVGLGPWFVDDIRPHLLTSAAIAEAYGRLHETTEMHFSPFAWPQTLGQGGSLMMPSTLRFRIVKGAGPAWVTTGGRSNEFAGWAAPNYFSFERSAHCLFALLAGGLGALHASWFEGRSGSAPKRSEGA